MAAQLTEQWNHSVWSQVAKLVAHGVATGFSAPPQPAVRVRQHQIRLNASQVAQLVADYQAGASVSALTRKYRIRHETAVRWLKINGVTIRPNRVGVPKERLAKAVALRNQGWSWYQLGRHYGCSHTAVRNALLRRA